jgi:hypothetical protein
VHPSMMPPQRFGTPQGVGMAGPQFSMPAPQAMTLASPMQPRPQQVTRLQDQVGMPLPQMMPQEQALQARRLAPQQFGPMGGPGFAQPLSPPPSQQQQMTRLQDRISPVFNRPAPQPLGGPMGGPQPFGGPQQQQMQQQMLGGPQQQGGQAMGGAKWTMEIKPSEGMATGGMIEERIPAGFTDGVEVLNFDSTAPLPTLENPNMMSGSDLPVESMQDMNQLIDMLGAGVGEGPTASALMESELMGGGEANPMSLGHLSELGMMGGGVVPMVYMNGGYIPAYGLGGFLKKVAKGALKIAPIAAMAIPGIGPLASAGIGGLAGTLGSKLEGGDWGSALSKGIGTGIKSFAGKKALDSFLGGFGGGEEGLSFLQKLEGGLGGLKDAFSKEDVAKLAPYLLAGEAMEQGHAGGAGTDIAQTTIMPGGGGGGGGGGFRGTITDVEAPTAERYNLFTELGEGRAGGGSLYAISRFGGGEIDEYRRGGRVRKRGKRGRRGRRGGRESSRPRRSPRRSVRPPARAPVQRAQPVAPPPPPTMAAPDMMPAIPDVMPVAPPPPPVQAPAPPPPGIRNVKPIIEDVGLPMMPQPAAPKDPRKMSPERERPVDIPMVGGFIPSPEGEPAPVAPEIEEILPATTGRGEERRRSRRGREGGEGRGLMGSEGGGERREERRSRDSGRRSEEGGELGGERGETTSGRANPDYSYEEGDRGNRMTPEQELMAQRFATKDPESMLTSGPDESAEMENIRAIAQGKPADDIASVDGNLVENTSKFDPTPTSLPGVQNPELLAQRDAELMAKPVTYQRPPPPPPTMQSGMMQAGDGLGLFDAPTGGTPANLFGSGASPFDMPTEAAQFEDPRMRAMLERMDAPEAPLESYVPEPEEKAEGGLIQEMQQDETGAEILSRVAQALQDPENPENVKTIQGFQEAFGSDALQELVQTLSAGQAMQEAPMDPQGAMLRQQGGLVPGAGDAMADNIMGVVDPGKANSYPIKFSSGEFVVAGDVVSGLGSGNTNAGAQVLNQLQDDVRMARNGTTQQAPPIDLSEVLPGTYGKQHV